MQPATATHVPSDGRAFLRIGIIVAAASSILAVVLGWMVDGAMWSLGTSVHRSDVRLPDIAEKSWAVALVCLLFSFTAGAAALASMDARRWRSATAWVCCNPRTHLRRISLIRPRLGGH